MQEVYFDEKKNKEPGGNFEPSPPPPTPPGNGFGGGGGSWIKPEIDDPDKTEEPEWIGKDAVPDKKLMRVSASGRLMVDANGRLISCQQLCDPVPAILVYVKRPEGIDETHAQCIQLNLVYSNLNPLLNYPDRQLQYDLWPRDLTQEGNFYAGTFPLPDPGENLQVKLKWQAGHYDIGEFSEMKIVLFGRSCGFQSISLSKWRSVADIRVNEERHIFVNNVRAKLRGNE